MAMTKAELAKQMEALQAQYDEMEDDDDELWIRLSNGNEVCLKGERLKKYLKKHGLEEEVEIDDSTEVVTETKPTRKTAAKKTTAPRKTTKAPAKELEEELDEIDDILEEEAEEVSPRRFF